MNGVHHNGDALVGIIAAARNQGRVVVTDLLATLVPLLPPERRTFPEHVVRQIERGDVFDDRFLRDLDALISTIDALVMNGTRAIWIADEHHVYGGYDTVVRDNDTADLAAAAVRLNRLYVSIARVVDLAQAVHDAEKLHIG